MGIKSAKIILLYGFIGITFVTAILVLLANIGTFGEAVRDGEFAKWGMGAVLGEIIIVIIAFFKQSFGPTTKIQVNLTFPDPLMAYDIDLDREKCFLETEKNGKKKKRKIIPVLKQTWLVKLPIDIQTSDDEIKLLLTEKNGRKWEAWFYPNVLTQEVTQG